MKILHYLDAIFIKLSIIPGLGFLHEYVEELEIQKQRRRILTDQYRGYAGALRDAGQAAKHGGHGHDEREDHEKPGKKTGRRGRWGRPARGGQVARPPHKKEEDDLDEDYYEDDDFESYLQR